LTAEHTGVEKTHLVDFAASPVVAINPPEGFDVSDERPRFLVFLRIDQCSPILA
jgi:hypothetical protein